MLTVVCVVIRKLEDVVAKESQLKSKKIIGRISERGSQMHETYILDVDLMNSLNYELKIIINCVNTVNKDLEIGIVWY